MNYAISKDGDGWRVGDPFLGITLPTESEARLVLDMLERSYQEGQSSVWHKLSKAIGVPLPPSDFQI